MEETSGYPKYALGLLVSLDGRTRILSIKQVGGRSMGTSTRIARDRTMAFRFIEIDIWRKCNFVVHQLLLDRLLWRTTLRTLLTLRYQTAARRCR